MNYKMTFYDIFHRKEKRERTVRKMTLFNHNVYFSIRFVTEKSGSVGGILSLQTTIYFPI